MASLRGAGLSILGGVIGAIAVAGLAVAGCGDDTGNGTEDAAADAPPDGTQPGPDVRQDSPAPDVGKDSPPDTMKDVTGQDVPSDTPADSTMDTTDAVTDVTSDGGDANETSVENDAAPDAADGSTDAIDASDGDAGDASDGPYIPDGLLDYAGNHARALCAAISNCCAGLGTAPLDMTACESNFLTQGWDNTLPETTALYDRGNLTFDATQAATCISAIQGLGCAAQLTASQWSAITTACQNVLGGLIAIDAGPCVSSFECVSGAYCNSGTCAPLAGDGGTCTADNHCRYAATGLPSMFCNLFASDGGSLTSGTCQPALANGGTCANATMIDDYVCTSLLCGDDSLCGDPATNPSQFACQQFQDAGGGG